MRQPPKKDNMKKDLKQNSSLLKEKLNKIPIKRKESFFNFDIKFTKLNNY